MTETNRRLGYAWVALCAVLAAHVADEAMNDFLGWWNPAVQSLRARAPWVPLPTFRFEVWLGWLTAATAALFALSPLAFRGAPAMRPLAKVFALVMIGNGAAHILLSLYLDRMAPGVYTAPLLLGVGGYLLVAAILARPRGTPGPQSVPLN